MSNLHRNSRAARNSYLLFDSDPNQSTVLGSALSRGREKVSLSFLRVDFTASSDVGTRVLRLQIRDADGEVRHTRDLGSVDEDEVVKLAIPFAYPYPDPNDGLEVRVPAQALSGGSVDATDSAPNLTVTALDTWYPLYAEAAPAAYPVARGTRVYGVSNVVVKDDADTVTYVEGTDYYVDYNLGKIMALTGGAISALDDLVVDFDYALKTLPRADVGQKDAVILRSGWSVVIEDTADIEDTNDVLDVYFHGTHLSQ